MKEDKPIKTDRVVGLAQLNHHAVTMSIGEQVHESSKPMPASNKIQQEKPAMTSETAPFTESAIKAGRARVNDRKRKNKSDSNKVEQPMRDGKKTAGLMMEKVIEKPILSRDNGLDGKREAESRQGRAVLVKKGDTLFRIIYRAYGTYNAKIVNLVLKENPKISSSTHIVAGHVIKLPEIN
jgi:phage tail protein X